ncbi:MAG: hypothetical protein PQJ60_08925 [Spirochaetales bacterium]|nr:hypothetical protein [Spirochaetales bacterium]
MKKTILATMMFTALAGAALFANGSDESIERGRGPGRGIVGEDGVEIVDLEGTVVSDGYGNLMIDEGKTNYLLVPVPSMGLKLDEGAVLAGEGFEGNTLYTKDGESYINFYLTKATVDGEEYIIDMKRIGSDRGGRNGSENRGRPEEKADHRDDRNDHGARGARDERGGAIPEDAVKTTVAGTVVLDDENHPILETADASYMIRMGRMIEEQIAEGAAVEATGYVSEEPLTKEGKDYYRIMLTALTVDGVAVELEEGGPARGRMGAKN